MSSLFDIPELPREMDVRDIRPWLEQIRRAVLALRPSDSATVKATVTAQGTLYRSAGGSSGSSFAPPLWLQAVDSENVKVSLGTVAGILPTNVDTDIDVSGTDGTWNIYLDATVSATTGAVSAVTISTNTSTVPSDSSTHAYLLLGQVVVASSVITSVDATLGWSQDFVACTPGDTDTYHWQVA